MRFVDAVEAQPENLIRSRRSVETALSRINLRPLRVVARLGFVGMGASSHAFPAVLAEMRERDRSALAFDADEAPLSGDDLLFDGLVALSQGGNSPETVAVVEAHPLLPSLAITADGTSELARVCEAVVPLDLLEDSAVYTLGFTAALQALGLLGDRLSDRTRSWDTLPTQVEQTLEEAGDALRRLGPEVPSNIDFVASAGHLSAAREGALIAREAAWVPSAWHSTRQYLHGPFEALSGGGLLVAVGSGREIDLAEQAAASGARVLLVTTAERESRGNLVVLTLPALDPVPLAVLEILPLQLLAGGLAAAQGLKVDGFRYPQLDTKLSPETTTQPSASLGLDVGGSKLAVALVVGRDPEPLLFASRPTPKGTPQEIFDEVVRLVSATRKEARELGHDVGTLGIGMPELVGLDGRVESDVVVPGLGELLSSRVVAPGLEVRVESDVRAAATAEAVYGAGREYESFCYVSVGTGISFCLVRGRVPLRGARGLAIQLGNSVAATFEQDGSESRFVLEERASGPAIVARYLALGGAPLTTEQILARLETDPAAREAVVGAAHDLGVGLALIVNLLDPEAVVLGGGLGSADGPFFAKTVASAREFIWAEAARDLPIVQATLGPRSAAIGAAMIGSSGRRH